MKKRDRYIDRLRKSRLLPPIELVYLNGHVEPFHGRLHDLLPILQIDLVPEGTKLPWTTPSGHRDHTREPSFIIEPRIKFGRYRPIGVISLFTKTSKMRCPSFSLPVGPPKQGGTCLVAGQPSIVEDDDLFICHGCYASDGNYRQNSTQLTASVRRIAVIRGVKNRLFATAVTAALTAYRSKPRYDDVKAKVDGKMRKVGVYRLDTNYIRIHDAGDVLWLPGYLEAWVEVANAIPQVRFWMPCRDWALGQQAVRRLRNAKASAGSNFVIRPSALHVGDQAPDVTGLDAGTAVAFDAKARGLAEINCPAYDQKKDKSCQTARCRRCWTQPTKTVNYEPHGKEMTMKKLAGAIAQRNPTPALVEAYEAYLEDPSRNPADDTGFEVWLARSGLYAGDWKQEEWWSLLHQIGLDGDESAEYLENVAEWQP